MATAHRHDEKTKEKKRSASPDAAGSLTVEAAAAVPFFFLCMVALITLLNAYGAYAAKVVKLQERAEQAAVLVAGADAGHPVVDLIEPLTIHPFGAPFALPALRVMTRGRVRAWVGADPAETSGDGAAAADDILVYVTEHESVYHTDSACTHLDLEIRAVSSRRVGALRNKSRHRYHACEKCIGSGGAAGTVYYSPQGDAYHNEAACSGLTRHVQMKHKGDLQGLAHCSRCAARAAS